MADEGFPEVAAPDLLDDAEFSGYLQKKRPFKKLLSIKYQRRWCVIQNNIFYYFDGPLDRKQKGAFSLQGYRFFHLQDSDKSFALVGKGKRSFEFIAPTKDQFINWEKAVSKSASGFSDIQSKMLGRTTSVPVGRNRSFEDLYSAEKYMSEKYTSEKKQQSVRTNRNMRSAIKEEPRVYGTSPRAPPPVPKLKTLPATTDRIKPEQRKDITNTGVKYATLPPNMSMSSYEDYDKQVLDDIDASVDLDDYAFVRDFPPFEPIEIERQYPQHDIDASVDLDDYAFVRDFPPFDPIEIERQYPQHGEEMMDDSDGYETLPVALRNMSSNIIQQHSLDEDDYAVVHATERSQIISEELYVTNLPNQKIPKCPNFPLCHKTPPRCKLDPTLLEDDTYIEFCVSDEDPSKTFAKKQAPSSSITRLLQCDHNKGSDDDVDDIYLDLSVEGQMSDSCPIQEDVCKIDWSDSNKVPSKDLHSYEPIYANYDPESVKQKITVHLELLGKIKPTKQASYDIPDSNELSSDEDDDEDDDDYDIDYENVSQKLF